MKRRTRSRELALQFLYQLDLLGPETLDELSQFLRAEERDRTTVEFADHLVRGTLASRDSLDEVIRGVAQNWEIDRMAVIDRNVLRMATFELLHCPDIPPKVSINEAIELGKRFSTQNSGGFINGILDKIKDSQGIGSPRNPESSEPEAKKDGAEENDAEVGASEG